jgi:hypothetical protein
VVALLAGLGCGLAVARGDVFFSANHGRAPMRRPYHYRRPNPDRRRALELLAASRKGCTKALMRAHGLSIDMLLDLLKAGLATTKRERMVAGGRQTDVARVRITEAGREALAKMSK